jgi:glutathionyl-hydroquinone reductase
VRALKGLEDIISYSTVDWLLAEGGWRFTEEFPDPLHADYVFLRQVYLMSDPEYAGKITVPVLFDKRTLWAI